MFDLLIGAVIELLSPYSFHLPQQDSITVQPIKPVKSISVTRQVKLRNPDEVRAYAREVSRSRGYNWQQWKCLDTIIYRESRWVHTAKTGSHYGLGQIAGLKVGTPVPKQLQRIFKYINHRYGTPCKALAHSYKYNWY